MRASRLCWKSRAVVTLIERGRFAESADRKITLQLASVAGASVRARGSSSDAESAADAGNTRYRVRSLDVNTHKFDKSHDRYEEHREKECAAPETNKQ